MLLAVEILVPESELVVLVEVRMLGVGADEWSNMSARTPTLQVGAGNWPSVSGYDLLAGPLEEADLSTPVGVIDWISLGVDPDWQPCVAVVVMAAAEAAVVVLDSVVADRAVVPLAEAGSEP